MIKNYYGADKFNKKGLRNMMNTNKLHYNCGGYALETYNWYCPYPTEDKGKEMFGYWASMSLEEKLEISVKQMLREFKGTLRVIDDIDELENDEYAVAFKLGERDFHFAKRTSRGNWLQKRGNTPKIETMTKERVFSEEWAGGIYSSRLVLFAKKKKK